MYTKEIAIKDFLTRHGTGFVDGKKRINELYHSDISKAERIKAVISEFGIGGTSAPHTGEYIFRDGVYGADYNNKGIDLKWMSDWKEEGCLFSWKEVDEVLEKLVKSNLYYKCEDIKNLKETLQMNFNIPIKKEKNKMARENIIISEGVNVDLPVVKAAYNTLKGMEAKMKEEGRYPQIEYTKQDKTKYTADARITISTYEKDDNTTIAQAKIVDGLQNLQFSINEKGEAYGVKVSAYSPKNKNFYEPKNVSPNLSVFADEVKNTKKTYDKPFVKKEAFDAYIAFKKAINSLSPSVDIDGASKKEYYVKDIEVKPFKAENGKEINMYEFEVKGRKDETITIKVNERGEFAKAEITHFNGKGETPTYTVIKQAEDLDNMSDKNLGAIVNEAITVLPERQEREQENDGFEQIDADVEVEME